MIIYTPTHDPCFPLCNYCTDPIMERGLKTKRGKYYHLNCYEQYWHDITYNVDKIIAITQDSNSGANSLARRIKAVLNDA